LGTTRQGQKWEVFCGDAETVLKDLRGDPFNCVVTSPPYYWLRDYDVPGQTGMEESVDDYVSTISSSMEQVFEVLADNGVLFLNLGDTYYSGKGESQGKDPKSAKRRFGLRAVDKSGGVGIGIRPKSVIGVPWRVAIAMANKRKWVLRSAIIWHRRHALPEAVGDRPRRSYEYVFMFVKRRKYYFNRQAIRKEDVGEDVWTIPARPKVNNGIDTAPFPDELVRRCLELGCPPHGRVLDPYAGSGTTLRVALNSGHDAVGIDLSVRFCEYMAGNLESLA
jgi:DNA modification methylase